jgi:hypothetical protein
MTLPQGGNLTLPQGVHLMLVHGLEAINLDPMSAIAIYTAAVCWRILESGGCAIWNQGENSFYVAAIPHVR